MPFVVYESVNGKWINRGSSPSYAAAREIEATIKNARLAKGERAGSVEKKVKIRNEFHAPGVQQGQIGKDRPRSDRPAPDLIAPIAYIGSLLLLFLVCKVLSTSFPLLARLLLGIGLGVWILAPVIAAIRGMKLCEILGMLKGLSAILAALFVIALIMPASCSSQSGQAELEWARKP